MNKTLNGVPTPTANLAINKSRLKVYGKKSEVPTYYLEKGQEFQIELFNPTKENILAKISLNGKHIGQGGLVLRPGERVFLDRYIDVARKFKFDTYEVANTSEVRKAIEENGDFKVDFYNEYIPPVNPTLGIDDFNIYYDGNNTFQGPNIRRINYYNANLNVNSNGLNGSIDLANLKTTNTNYSQPVSSDINLNGTLDFMDTELSRDITPQEKTLRSRIFPKKTKSIETGRVEMGSTSNQKMTTVNMNWLTIPFHTVEYKMLPVSQKVNTTQDLQVKRYCTNCGTKQKPSFKFCPSCGAKC
jgi:hypothetical protein